MTCIIRNCGSKSKDTTLFCIPVTENIRRKWIEAIERHQPFDYSLRDPIFVCIRHFQPDEIIRGVRKKIAANVVPSIFRPLSDDAAVKRFSPANNLMIVSPITIKPNLVRLNLKRSTSPPIGPMAKITKLTHLPQNNVQKNAVSNNLIGKKMRLNIGNLKKVTTLVGASHAPNANKLQINMATAKSPVKISNSQIRTVSLPNTSTLSIGTKFKIVTRKKISKLLNQKSCDVQAITQKDPLQSNPTSDAIPKDHIAPKPQNLSNSTEQRLKVVDINKLKQTTVLSKNPVETNSHAPHKVNGNCDRASNNANNNNLVNYMQKLIKSMQTQISSLKNENESLKLYKKTKENDAVAQLLNQRIIHSKPTEAKSSTMLSPTSSYSAEKKSHTITQCTLCKKWYDKILIDKHLCLDQDSVMCHICNFKCTTTKSFMEHIDSLHKHDQYTGGVHLHKCDECDNQFTNAILLEFHKVSHRQSLPDPDLNFYKCGKCPETFVKLVELRDHVNQVHWKVHNTCYLCGKIFTGHLFLEAHINRVHRRIFECKICKPKLELLQEFHLAHVGESNIGQTRMPTGSKDINIIFDEPKFECYICKIEMNQLSDLRNHMKDHERNQECKICKESLTVSELSSHLCGQEKKICCEYCDKSFTSTFRLLEHLKKPHENRKLYRCSKCPLFFPMTILRIYHMAQHNNEVLLPMSFLCNVCGKTFKTSYQLDNHKKTHEEKSFLCDECGASLRSEQALKKHKLSSIHSNTPTHSCPHCPRKFYHSSGLWRHVVKHEGFKYVCDYNNCSKELTSHTAYLKHKKIHTRTIADKRFECKFPGCSMKFYDTKHLKKHQTVHTDERPFMCEFCDVSYKYKGDLNKHLRIHIEGGKIHKCPVESCGLSFYYPEELEQHEIEHYKMDKEKNKEESAISFALDETLSPSVTLKSAFVHDNVQLWH